jgi:PEP-CTERM motif
MKNSFKLLVLSTLLSAGSSANALTFNFTFLASSTPEANQGFLDAAARWSSLFTNDVTLNMTVGTAALGTGILASTGSVRTTVAYSDFKFALTNGATSAADFIATSNLPNNSFGMLLNRTSDNPNGSGSATAYVDNDGSLNNTSLRLTNANAKALGFAVNSASTGACASSCDASITFGNAFAWDYNPNNGITAGAYDFVGIATHELGHALGFISGVDILDTNSPNPTVPGPFSSNQFNYVNSLDLFRFSALSKASNVIDWTADTRAKYFSIDGGVTNQAGATFSTGRTFGDGNQASHWKDNLGLGIMDPTASQGERLAISDNDKTAFDVIGWNLVSSVPEPGTYIMFGMGLLTIGLKRRASAKTKLSVA